MPSGIPEGIWCFLFCFGFAQPASPKIIDAYCQTYVQVVKSPDDLEKIKAMPRVMRDRVQGNDLEYLCRCKGWKDKACGLTTP